MLNSNGKMLASTHLPRHSHHKLPHQFEPFAVLCSCCHRLQNGQDEGRDAFKSLKNQQIADKSALLYSQWADLEVKAGTVCPASHVQLSLT